MIRARALPSPITEKVPLNAVQPQFPTDHDLYISHSLFKIPFSNPNITSLDLIQDVKINEQCLKVSYVPLMLSHLICQASLSPSLHPQLASFLP